MNSNIQELSAQVENKKRLLLDSNERNTSLSRPVQDEQEKNKDLMAKNAASSKTQYVHVQTRDYNFSKMSTKHSIVSLRMTQKRDYAL